MKNLFDYLLSGSKKSEYKDVHKTFVRLSTMIDEYVSGGHSESLRDELKERREAEEKLFNLAESDPDILSVLTKYNVTVENLKLIYAQLIESGAGQPSGNKWIPVSAITDTKTLDYLLRNLQGKKLPITTSNEDVDKIVYDVLAYFKYGENLPENM
jgi:hypothetical protein